VGLAEKVIKGDIEKIGEFFEDKNEDLKERLFLEFNTLSVIYQKPAERFLKDNVLKQAIASEKKYYSGRFKKVKKMLAEEAEATASPAVQAESAPVAAIE